MLRYALPGIDDIEEDNVDIDELINQEEEESDEERKGDDKGRKPTWDEQQLYQLLSEVGDQGLEEGEEEEDM